MNLSDVEILAISELSGVRMPVQNTHLGNILVVQYSSGF